jgi:hypothetical protein
VRETPFIYFAAETVGFGDELANFAASNGAHTALRVDEGDGRVDDGTLGGPADVCQIRQEGGKIEEASVKSFSALSLDSVVGSPAFGGVGTTGWFSACGPTGGSGSASDAVESRRLVVAVAVVIAVVGGVGVAISGIVDCGCHEGVA